MIGKLLRLGSAGVLYLCLGTILAQGMIVGYLASQGVLSRGRIKSALSSLYGLDAPPPPPTSAQEAASPAPAEQASFADLLKVRALKNLDLDLREQAIDKGLGDLQTLRAQLANDRRRYEDLKTSFDTHLAQLQARAQDNAVLEVQQTLEVISPKQSKDQILRMLDEGAMSYVVSIIKNMPLDKRKKILAEFKTEEESDKLAKILEQIRLGLPEVNLIENARGRLQQIDTTQR